MELSRLGDSDIGQWSVWSSWLGCDCRRKDTRFRMCRSERRNVVKNCRPTPSSVDSLLNDGTRIRNTKDVEFEEKPCPSKSYRMIKILNIFI